MNPVTGPGNRLGLIGSKRVVGALVVVVLFKSLVVAALVQTGGVSVPVLTPEGSSASEGSVDGDLAGNLPNQGAPSGNQTGEDGSGGGGDGPDGGGTGPTGPTGSDDGLCLLSTCTGLKVRLL